ncbi:HIT family protein [Ruminococcaceae bacterium OttesenSCG-928-A16]|nr:HIT family protein [Ruminococcaceae bacterium OttesenSCG-928-A16]
MDTCFYCEKNEKLDSLMIPIVELEYSNVYLNRDQKHKGRCIVALKQHKTEYFQLDSTQNAGFFAEVTTVAKALQNLFNPGKINYATFGDLVPHLHVHVVPKYVDGLQWGAPFDDSVPKQLCSEAEYQRLVQQIEKEIENLRQ